MAEPAAQPVRLVFTPKMQTLFATVLQALWIGFDSSYLIFYCHEIFKQITLTVAVTGFHATMFLGTLTASLINEKIDHWLLLFIFSLIRVILQFAMAFVPAGVITILFMSIIGFSIGVIFSTLLTFSIKKMTGPQGSLLVSVIYACFAGGTFILSILLERADVQIPVHTKTRMPMMLYPKNSTLLSEMHVHSRYPSTIVFIISVAFQAVSIYPFYLLWRTKDEQPTEEEEYHNIDGENKNLKKIIFLSSIMGFLTHGLFSFYPYFLFAFSYDKHVHIYFTVFCVTFLFGRVIYTAICRRKEHNVVLSFSFVLCGFSICVYSFEPARVVSSALYGIGLSMINPVLTVYVGQMSRDHVHVLISCIALSPLVFTFPLTLLLNNFGPQVFASINFFILIFTVFFFVWLLNIQSKMDKPEGEHAATIWRFFRGEGALKRTRSIRKFIGSIRGSIRGRRYRRMQGAASPLSTGNPVSPTQLHVRRPSPNRLSPNSHGARTYRSTQNRHNPIEIEDESSSAATVSTPTI